MAWGRSAKKRGRRVFLAAAGGRESLFLSLSLSLSRALVGVWSLNERREATNLQRRSGPSRGQSEREEGEGTEQRWRGRGSFLSVGARAGGFLERTVRRTKV